MKQEIENQLVPYNLETAKIEELKTKYLGITIPPGDKAAYAMVMSGLRECREIRLDVDAWHKEKKAWIVKAGKHYDSERRRVHALVEPIEEPLKSVRQTEDNRIEAIKAEQIRQEQERVDKIRTRIASMSLGSVVTLSFKTSADIKTKRDEICDIFISPDEFQEFSDEATRVKSETIAKLTEMYEDRKRLEDEAERIEKVRKEQEAEAARLAAEKKAQDETAAKIRAEQEAEAKRLEDEKRKIQEEKERAAFEAMAKQQAEKNARAKVEAEAKAKAEAERKAEEEKARQEALKPDKEKLLKWIAYFNDTNIPRPSLGSNEAKRIYLKAIGEIEIVLQGATRETEAL